VNKQQISGPVLTIDGPSGAGKGTISKAIAEKLDWHYLDSGALYRVLGIAALDKGISLDNEVALAELAEHIDLQFVQDNQGQWLILLDKQNVAEGLQAEQVGAAASKIAVYPRVRKSLLHKQRHYQKLPGLVADGRDMGSTVFPEAKYKVFLTASAKERANRRYKQLKEKGINANLPAVLKDIELRDKRDTERASSPLSIADGALYLDTSDMTINQAVNEVLTMLEERK